MATKSYCEWLNEIFFEVHELGLNKAALLAKYPNNIFAIKAINAFFAIKWDTNPITGNWCLIKTDEVTLDYDVVVRLYYPKNRNVIEITYCFDFQTGDTKGDGEKRRVYIEEDVSLSNRSFKQYIKNQYKKLSRTNFSEVFKGKENTAKLENGNLSIVKPEICGDCGIDLCDVTLSNTPDLCFFCDDN